MKKIYIFILAFCICFSCSVKSFAQFDNSIVLTNSTYSDISDIFQYGSNTGYKTVNSLKSVINSYNQNIDLLGKNINYLPYDYSWFDTVRGQGGADYYIFAVDKLNEVYGTNCNYENLEQYYTIYYMCNYRDFGVGTGINSANRMFIQNHFIIVPKSDRVGLYYNTNIDTNTLYKWTNSTYAMSFTYTSALYHVGNEYHYTTIESNDIRYGSFSSVYAVKDYKLLYTNIPLFDSPEDCTNYIDTGSPVNVNNKDVPTYSIDEFGFKNMTCRVVPGAIDDGVSLFNVNYNYEMFPNDFEELNLFFKTSYTVKIYWKNSKGVINTATYIKNQTWWANSNKSSKVDILKLPSSFTDREETINSRATYENIQTFFNNSLSRFMVGDLLPVYSETVKNEITGVDLWVTTRLYKPDEEFINDNSNIAEMSNSVYMAKFNLLSGSFKPVEEEEINGQEQTPQLSYTETVDDDGKVVDKKVSNITATDGNQTIINITIDNGQEIDNSSNSATTNEINNSGGGSITGFDKNTTLAEMTSSVTDTIDGVYGDGGLFSLVKAYFDFIPASFWNILIALLVVIGIVIVIKIVSNFFG